MLLSLSPPHPLPLQSCTSSEDCGTASVCLGLYVHPSQLDYPFNIRDNNTCGTCINLWHWANFTLHHDYITIASFVTSSVAETSPGSFIIQRFKVLVCGCGCGCVHGMCVCACIQCNFNVLHLRMP